MMNQAITTSVAFKTIKNRRVVSEKTLATKMAATTTIPFIPRDVSHLYVIPRHGRIIKRHWDELTYTEKDSIREAERRAAFVEQFNIYE